MLEIVPRSDQVLPLYSQATTKHSKHTNTASTQAWIRDQGMASYSNDALYY